MVRSSSLLVGIVLTVLFINICVLPAPSDYCYAQINTSDCELAPIPVFTYYKAGSRCEIELWRGCPTLNKFENEYECSHFCVGKLSPSFSVEVDNQIDSEESTNPECIIPINLADCAVEEDVYTYNYEAGICEKVQWRGCETYNMYEDYDSCLEACMGFMKDSEEKEEGGIDDGSQEGEDGHGGVTSQGEQSDGEEYGGKDGSDEKDVGEETKEVDGEVLARHDDKDGTTINREKLQHVSNNTVKSDERRSNKEESDGRKSNKEKSDEIKINKEESGERTSNEKKEMKSHTTVTRKAIKSQVKN